VAALPLVRSWVDGDDGKEEVMVAALPLVRSWVDGDDGGQASGDGGGWC